MTQHTPVPFRAEEYRGGGFFNLRYWRVVGADHTDENWQVVADGLTEATAQFIVKACNEHEWMRREIERAGDALFTTTSGKYTGTEEDLQAVGQFVEGAVEALFSLKKRSDIYEKALEDIADTSPNWTQKDAVADSERRMREIAQKALAKAREGK